MTTGTFGPHWGWLKKRVGELAHPVGLVICGHFRSRGLQCELEHGLQKGVGIRPHVDYGAGPLHFPIQRLLGGTLGVVHFSGNSLDDAHLDVVQDGLGVSALTAILAKRP